MVITAHRWLMSELCLKNNMSLLKLKFFQIEKKSHVLSRDTLNVVIRDSAWKFCLKHLFDLCRYPPLIPCRILILTMCLIRHTKPRTFCCRCGTGRMSHFESYSRIQLKSGIILMLRPPQREKDNNCCLMFNDTLYRFVPRTQYMRRFNRCIQSNTFDSLTYKLEKWCGEIFKKRKPSSHYLLSFDAISKYYVLYCNSLDHIQVCSDLLLDVIEHDVGDITTRTYLFARAQV
ncbi:hypothetical protein EDC94DRAFT_650977 [Helicostylum pulchrum]|nr:hypothetical protein EDC94DRAFT_650977 [Helicostylum pulchrum]